MTDARTITLSLGGRWHGSYGAAPCPVCQPEGRRGQHALTLADGADGRLLAHCKKLGCAFAAILAAAGLAPGGLPTPDPARMAERDRERRAEAERRAAQARACWEEALPIDGTPAESYLRGRGITCPMPGTLRFHPACWHGATARRLPALVAVVEGAVGSAAFSDASRARAPARSSPESPIAAVHRTYLRPDGSGKAKVEPAKAMLGACRGGRGAARARRGPPRGGRGHRDRPEPRQRSAGRPRDGLGGALHHRDGAACACPPRRAC